MKSILKLLFVPLLCQVLFCSQVAMAKKDKSDDSDSKKSSKKQETPARVQTDPNTSKSRKKSEPSPQKTSQKPKSDPKPAPVKARKRDKTDKPAIPKKQSPPRNETKPTAKKESPTPPARQGQDKGKKSTPPVVKESRKEDKPSDSKGSKSREPMPLPGKSAEKRQDDSKDKDSGNSSGKRADTKKGDSKGKEPMPLPGKSAEKRQDDSKDKDSGNSSGKRADTKKGDSKGKEPMPLPGRSAEKRQDDSKDKDSGNSSGKRADSKKDDKSKSAKNKAEPARARESLALPGKRPKAPVTDRAANRARTMQANQSKLASRPKARDAAGKTAGIRRDRVVRPGQNSRQVRRPDLVKNKTNNTWWNTNNKVVNKTRITNNTTVINNNFERNVNWSTGRRSWGYNPWWNRPQVRPWYGSSWSGSWNRDYYRYNYHYDRSYHGGYRPPGYVSVGTAIGWGLIGWSLGTLVYDTGYQTYHNPYPVRTQVSYRGSSYDYSQPIARVAVETAPEDVAAVEELTSRSESIIAESQSAFRERNYLVALELADKAIAESPGDGALHEYRALVLFALGKYGDAAGVLNPVLASGPGWDWSTMVALYDSQQTYTDQLGRLETYTESNPDSADTHFLLGYHYMVCGHNDLATPQFDMATKLMPADSVSKQLAELTSATADPSEEQPAVEEDVEAELPEPEPVPLEKLAGTWVSSRDDGSSVTLSFREDGKFVWTYSKEGKTSEFAGDYSMNDDGLLVLDSDESQMVASVEIPQDREMKFVLAGGPPEDPGLDFTKG